MGSFLSLKPGNASYARARGCALICLYFFIALYTLRAHAGQTLVFGILPAESPVVLFKHFAPLRDYLAEQIHENIVLETARDFSVYARRTAARRYDIVFTAPHMVMPALDSGHYELVATFIKPLSAVVVVKQDSPFNNLQSLTDMRIATPPHQAIVTQVGIALLKQQEILKNEDTRVKHYHSHNAAYCRAGR